MGSSCKGILGRVLVSAVLAILAAACGSEPPKPPPEPPETKPAPAAPSHEGAVDTYHGVTVEDPWRWLEDGNAPDVRAWSREQNERARAHLDALPAAAGVRKRLDELLTSGAPSWSDLTWAGGRLFALKNKPPLQQKLLVVLASAEDLSSETIVVDPNAIDSTGGTSIDLFVPSHDGKLVAVSLSKGGSESGDVHVYETQGGKALPDVIPRVNGGTAGGSVAWNGDGTGLYYTRYPRAGERPEADLPFYQQVYFHRLGEEPEKDRYEVGRDFPKIAEVHLESSPDGRRVLANVQKGDGGEFTQHLRLADGSWVPLTRYEDRIVHAILGGDGAIYLVSRLDAPRGRVLRLAIGTAAPALRDAAVVVPEGTDAIDTDFASASGCWSTKSLLFVRYQTGGPTAVRVFDFSGKSMGALPSEEIATVGSVVALDRDDVLYRQETYRTPPAWLSVRPGDRSSRPTKLVENSPADFSDTEVVKETAVSKDGTKVPIFLLRRRGTKLDGTNPTLLYGYGGYGVSRTPGFRARLRVWIEQGGVYAEAVIRGGGEFGEEWHRGGNLERKQNVFDDFAAAANRLVEAKITSPEHLAIIGGSNGGLLMGAMITQHPEMFRAVSSSVGIYDMLRVERTPNGAFNVTEFGTVDNPEQFRALYAYSPYHHVTDGTRYPAVLMLTGENDPRVDPWHSRKMAARLQKATSSGLPVLLRTSASTGHGIGTPLAALVEEHTDVYSFLLDQLGVTYKAPAAAAASPAAAPAASPGEPVAGVLWRLVEIRTRDGAVIKPSDPDRYTLELGAAEEKVAVVADCNRGMGSFALEGNRLRFPMLAFTKVACPPGSQFDAYEKALQSVSTVEARRGKLTIALEGGGSMTFTLAP